MENQPTQFNLPFECPKCGLRFGFEKILSTHLEYHHSNLQRRERSLPRGRYPPKGSYPPKENIHEKLKVHQCHKCGKYFRLKEDLELHESTQTMQLLKRINNKVCGYIEHHVKAQQDKNNNLKSPAQGTALMKKHSNAKGCSSIGTEKLIEKPTEEPNVERNESTETITHVQPIPKDVDMIVVKAEEYTNTCFKLQEGNAEHVTSTAQGTDVVQDSNKTVKQIPKDVDLIVVKAEEYSIEHINSYNNTGNGEKPSLNQNILPCRNVDGSQQQKSYQLKCFMCRDGPGITSNMVDHFNPHCMGMRYMCHKCDQYLESAENLGDYFKTVANVLELVDDIKQPKGPYWKN